MKSADAIGVVVIVLLCSGCASDSPPAPASALNETDARNPFSSVFPENQSGLEVQWWTVTDRDDALARALARYAEEPTPLPETVRTNWRRNGMRMVRVPVEDMEAVLTSLPIEDKVNRIWLGQTPGWTVAAPGAPWTGHRALLIDGETIRLGAGQLRLLVRAWISPTESAPNLRTDLALQFLDTPLTAISRSPFEQVALRRPEIDGLIFRSLTAQMELSEAYAYCIISEDPDVDWGELTGSDKISDDSPKSKTEPTLPDRAPGASYSLDPDLQSPDDASELGPRPAGIPLLADALLSKIELLPTRRRARTIVILAPVIPESFNLAPTAAVNVDDSR